ncbi:TIGR03936 family radical SAM-associated protein [Haliovirga abyssi]|uniref:DUF2344 domain-containing protein n=1 Tax=Haliovirga abyssi TaxID=2996794 RepID=A0AAU9E1I7_9FUSO|nr:TIGR03936 family radical SAM-associated protein [Haliovirga abyssi]BDU50235.1 hypothetical protein HLVA_08040 [Haliovirga abyssi]
MQKRIFYNKYGRMKYVAHLDTISFFERLFKLSKIKIKFSGGFHPRPKFSFGDPVSLGVAMYNEPLDFETLEDISNDEILKRLNDVTPNEFDIIKVIDRGDKSSIVKDYDSVKYSVEFETVEDLKKIESIIKRDEIIVTKEKKGKTTQRDIKKFIRKYEIDNNIMFLYLERISPNAILRLEELSKEYIIKRCGYIEKKIL